MPFCGDDDCFSDESLIVLEKIEGTLYRLWSDAQLLMIHLLPLNHRYNSRAGPQCIAPGFPIEDEKILMPGMILSDGKSHINVT